MKTIVLDSGHAGMSQNVYGTPGKRSPIWDDGQVLYEGECNRQIKARVMELMRFQDMPYYDCCPEQTDISLAERVNRANKIDNSLFVSLHSNAGGGTGCEVFISENCSKKSEQMAKNVEDNLVSLKLPSGEVRMVMDTCLATIGTVGNKTHENIKIGKAGRSRWLGKRPKVRGVAMNPVDHPHGGGEGRTSGGRHPVSPWGTPAKGFRTRKKNKTSNKFIVSRRKK